MRYLFIFAHPDDETVSCAGTIKRLIEHGDEVIVVSATDGAAGEVHQRAQKKLQKLGSVAELRKAELQAVAKFLGIKKLRILDFHDGQITNLQVWGKLKEAFIDLIEEFKPDVIVTFDHTGWYFHLDHVGVSIAATLAYHEAIHRPLALLHVYMQVEGVKWKYVFPKDLPITHRVNATQHRDFKLQALALHASQDIATIQKKVLKEEAAHYEIFQLAFANAAGLKLFAHHPIFEAIP